MSKDPGAFRDNYSECDWIFDLFAYGFDFLDGRFMPSPDEGLDDRWDAEEEEIKSRDIVSKIVASDGAIPESLRQYLDIPGGDDEMQSPSFYVRLYSAMKAIDRAAADLNYLHALTRLAAKRWSRVSQYFERHGKQLQRNASGHVVFKPRYFEQTNYQKWSSAAQASGAWTPIQQRGEYLGSYFDNLLRVSVPSDCKLEFRILNHSQDFHDPAWTALRVGIVPFVHELKVRSADAQLLPGPLVLRKEKGGKARIIQYRNRWHSHGCLHRSL